MKPMLATLAVLGLLTLTADASAAEPAPAEPRKDYWHVLHEKKEETRTFDLSVNPLGLLIGRYSIQGEIMLVPHLAVTINPVFTYSTVTVGSGQSETEIGSLMGFGGELGGRFYSGKRGPEGFFVGPSFLFSSNRGKGWGGVEQSFLAYGAALDIGGQVLFDSGFTFSGGFGIQYTKTSEEISADNFNLASAIVAGGGIRPRFLVSLGYAF
ncbi:MAG: hypothetical protein U0270_25035 [Labilithrix sp.]